MLKIAIIADCNTDLRVPLHDVFEFDMNFPVWCLDAAVTRSHHRSRVMTEDYVQTAAVTVRYRTKGNFFNGKQWLTAACPSKAHQKQLSGTG